MKSSGIKFMKSCFIKKMYHNHVRSTVWLSVTSPPLRRWTAMCFHVLLPPFTRTLDLLLPMSFSNWHCLKEVGRNRSQTFPADDLSVTNGLVGQAAGPLYHSIPASKGGHWVLYSCCCSPESAALPFISGPWDLMHHTWQMTALVPTTHQENEM